MIIILEGIIILISLFHCTAPVISALKKNKSNHVIKSAITFWASDNEACEGHVTLDSQCTAERV